MAEAESHHGNVPCCFSHSRNVADQTLAFNSVAEVACLAIVLAATEMQRVQRRI
jgi:hypothetical protein